MNEAEQRFRKVEVLMIDYGVEMDDLEKETREKKEEIKEKFVGFLNTLLDEYQ